MPDKTPCGIVGGTSPSIRRRAVAAAAMIVVPLVVLSGCISPAVTRPPDSGYQLTGQRSGLGTLALGDTAAKIRAGDQLQLSVWGYPEFDVTAPVKPTGTVMIPLIGEMPAAELSKEEFTTKLKARLVEYVKEEPTVTVSVISLAGMKVAVMGAVTRQDNYPLTGDAPLVEVLMSAGGATPEADLRHVMIFRNGLPQNAINVDLPTSMQRGEVQKLPKVRTGDTVFVPRQENLIRDLSGFMADVLVVFGLFGLVY